MSMAYEPPAFVVIGDLREVTLGDKTWGFDRINQCAFYNCVQ
ncbi:MULTISPECIES: lasso RiPP family leader peptide-containing protein [Actinomadura]|uniref:Lasso RiPP family leader peptide-containing protein n=1 Tax=Actinomadura litoris TaxID=2678616 RepID=A0A7K1KUK4_9ACTN|nr:MULTISPECIES: lasso RiPP family leader peptide-containing protein [Actinomadura]MBT2207339.1 lasso RiPP family leader peptide-containing protein [Actinomadura sp. NEAU-AAG7]MUN35852.1 lasso RiPP family leader peptide-containing protein [Actinomadura litoris]